MNIRKYLLCCGAMVACVATVCVLCVVIFSGEGESVAGGVASGAEGSVTTDEIAGTGLGGGGETAGTNGQAEAGNTAAGASGVSNGNGAGAAGTGNGQDEPGAAGTENGQTRQAAWK